MSTDGVRQDLELALDLADRADAITLARFGALDLRIATKPDLTPVTDADEAVEAELRKALAGARPGDTIFGEEQGGTSTLSGRQWVVVPIDGTKNFVRGVPVWASLIALLEDGVPTVGVISAPALNRRWWAALGTGAYASVGGDEPQLRLLAVDEHAADRVARVVARGGEAGAVDKPSQRAGIDLEVCAVARLAHAGELARLVAEDLEGRALGRDRGERAVDRDRQGRVVAGAHDLVELVGGDQSLSLFLDVDIGDGQDQADLGVGGADLKRAARARLLGCELEAEQHRRGRARGDNAACHGERIGQ